MSARGPNETALQRSQRLRDETEHFPYLDEYDDPPAGPPGGEGRTPLPASAPLPCVVCFKPYDLLVGGVCPRCAPRWHGRLM